MEYPSDYIVRIIVIWVSIELLLIRSLNISNNIPFEVQMHSKSW